MPASFGAVAAEPGEVPAPRAGGVVEGFFDGAAAAEPVAGVAEPVVADCSPPLHANETIATATIHRMARTIRRGRTVTTYLTQHSPNIPDECSGLVSRIRPARRSSEQR